MSAFMTAMTTNDVATENGMPTHSTSGAALVDFFFQAGGFRKASEQTILTSFQKAFGEHPLFALKTLFYVRDIRGGMGERRLFRIILKWLAQAHPQLVIKNIELIPEFGRFDDLMETLGTKAEKEAVRTWALAMTTDNAGLAFKWVPRKGPWFGLLRKYVQLKAGEFRRLVAAGTDVVETKMCNREWGTIDYSHVPSQAGLLYRKAFSKRDGVRYADYLKSVEKGEAKINAATLYPSDIVEKILNGETGKELDVLWANLPDVFDGKSRKILPVCDVSESMSGQPLAVSIGLGLYLSERNVGPFKDVICTFSNNPTLVQLQSKMITTRVNELNQLEWRMGTNLERTFQVILKRAIQFGLPPSDMPTTILIISDMQFNACVRNPSANALTMIRNLYAQAGYQMPGVAFWNVRTSSGVPVKFDEQGTALISGYSPNVMKGVLQGLSTPIEMVLDIINQPRYDRVKI